MNALLIVASALVAATAASPLLTPYTPYPYAAVAGQVVVLPEDGSYRTGHLDRAIDLRGQYFPDAEGRYVADAEGKYQADAEGAYKPDAEGAYKADDEGAYKPDAEGQYDAASAHAVEALSEDGSYRGEPIAIAAYAAAPFAYNAAPIAYNAAPIAYNTAPLAYNAYPYQFGANFFAKK